MSVIQDRIDQGIYPLGSVLPREIDLAAEFQVSRNTVRQALQQLATDGFLDRRKRGGTRIASLGPSMKLRIDLDPQSSLKRLSQGSELHVLDRSAEELPDEIRQLWPDAELGQWHRVDCVRVTCVSLKPLSFTRVYLAPNLGDISKMIGMRRGQQFRLIEERHNEHMIRTKTTLEPVTIDPETAALLNSPSRGLGLKVIHAMIDDRNAAREIVVSVYPAERYKFELSFSLEE